MPFVQLNLPGQYPAVAKREAAEVIGKIYCEELLAPAGVVNVGFVELGRDNLYRTGFTSAETVALAMVDIRTGRSLDQRLRFAHRLTEACETYLAVPAAMFSVLFTQHPGEEAYRNGRFAPDWSPDEGLTRHVSSASASVRSEGTDV